MTEKLYENDSFLLGGKCRVESCKKTDGGFAVKTDVTVFFPEGGGQPGDRGKIGKADVLDTFFDGGEIIHLCSLPLEEGKEYTMAVDGVLRLDNIQQHTGEHMLSYAFWHLFGIKNVGFHMNSELATIDLEREVSAEEIKKAEEFCNNQIYQNLPIKTYYASLGELKNKKVRKISEKGGDRPRVVEIFGGDICTCCGTHAAFTGTVGIIKVVKAEKNRSGSRLTFLCGKRAFEFFEKQTEIARRSAEMFSSEFSSLPERICDMKQKISELNLTIKEKTSLLSEFRAREIVSSAKDGFAVSFLENVGQKEARTLLNKVCEKADCAVLVFAENSRINYVLGAAKNSPFDCKYLCEILNGLYGGKGGGSKAFAQGGGNFCLDWKERGEIFIKTAGRK